MTGEVIDFTMRHEELRLKVYKCPAGYWTIGFGHRVDDPHYPRITKEQAYTWLLEDLQAAELAALKLCPNLWPPPHGTGMHAEPRRLAALTDLVFNVGWGALDGRNPDDPVDDSRVVKALRLGYWEAAAAEFRQWCHARDPETGQMGTLPGLISRREEGAQWIEVGG